MNADKFERLLGDIPLLTRQQIINFKLALDKHNGKIQKRMSIMAGQKIRIDSYTNTPIFNGKVVTIVEARIPNIKIQYNGSLTSLNYNNLTFTPVVAEVKK